MKKLDPKQLQEIKNKLLAEKSGLSARLESLLAQDPFANPGRLNDNADINAEAGEESDHDRIQSLINQIKTDLTQIEEALAQVENGSYGFCINCGRRISDKRLSLILAAQKCIDCEVK